MKKTPLLLLSFLLLFGCEEKATDNLQAGQDWAHLIGIVKYAEDLTPVNAAFVRTQNHLETALTDSNGAYDLAVAIPKGEQESVILEVYKEGFRTVNFSALIEAGMSTNIPVITLERYLDSSITDTTITGSGVAAAIVLLAMNPDTLSVAGAAGPTSSQILCEVRDALGNAVDSLHATQVDFSFISDPGGGAHLYPTNTVTNSNGQVSSQFFSGTQAGIAIIKVKLTAENTFIVLPDLHIYQTGTPASIMLVSIEYDSVAVTGVGANEATTLTFVVRDAGGSPITSDQSALVNFAILGNTGGGEYLYPESDSTNAQGMVSTTLNSGTVAGAIQILARLATDSSVYCAPIAVAIHSGFPDQQHFAIFPYLVNFAGFNYFGRIDSIGAIVADQYANPVPQGTAVYFSSDAGVIEGSATTDSAGFAKVRLFSGPPTPPASYPFGTVFAQTVGQGGMILTDSTEVLFSGITQIYNVSPTGFDIADGNSQQFTFRVSDQNGYPLACGTQIKTTSTAGGLIGDIDVNFPDTQSQAWTYFSFVLFDNNPGDTDLAVIAAISINVTSPNGDASMIITGTID